MYSYYRVILKLFLGFHESKEFRKKLLFVIQVRTKANGTKWIGHIPIYSAPSETCYEVSDPFYQLLVMLEERRVSLAEIANELTIRKK